MFEAKVVNKVVKLQEKKTMTNKMLVSYDLPPAYFLDNLYAPAQLKPDFVFITVIW